MAFTDGVFMTEMERHLAHRAMRKSPILVRILRKTNTDRTVTVRKRILRGRWEGCD